MVAREVDVCAVQDLQPGASRKFVLAVEGREEECFVVRWGEGLFAWVNRCLHVPMTMDWVENRFFTEDGRYIQCATHGAWYEPDTGECIAGPPCGKSLIRVPIEIRDGRIWARSPE